MKTDEKKEVILKDSTNKSCNVKQKNEKDFISSKVTILKDGNQPDSNAGTDSPSFFDQVYNKIEEVIGGDNPNQFLCLTIPGQVLSAEDYAYDYEAHIEKGPVVEANESKLANKLFDACRVTGADNGMTLPYQYQSALNTLTPKLNLKVAVAKNQVRDLLMTKYQYDFGDGKKDYTLQQVFYRLYEEYVKAERAWEEKQETKKEELGIKYSTDNKVEDDAKLNDAYLQWYETVAKGELLLLNEKRSKVLAVFTPNDMEILDGVLDSGVGAELEQARIILENTKKQTPDDGIVYPVKFTPTDWFNLLGTSFISTDLLESPQALAIQMKNLSVRRLSLSARLKELSSLVSNANDLAQLETAVSDAQKEMDNVQQGLIQTYGEGARAVIDTYFDVASLFKGDDGELDKDKEEENTKIANKLAEDSNVDKDKIGGLVKDLVEAFSKGMAAQQKYIEASNNLSGTIEKYIIAKNDQSLTALISPIQEQLDKINLQIDDITNKRRSGHLVG